MSLSFSPDGRTLASTGPEPMIRLWDVADGREVFPQSGHRSGIRNLVVSPADCDDLHGRPGRNHPALGHRLGSRAGRDRPF